jgi:zinc protease
MNKYKKIFSISILAIAMQGCSDTGSNAAITGKPLSNDDAISQVIQLPIEKYQLANGLEVVLHQDKSDPVVAVAIQYHVGSNREKPGRTGFAHFFEHMLFQNSAHVGAGNFIKNIGAMGGTLNGGTWQDGTIYYEVVPNDGLEKVLWMESDRMGYFIDTITEQGLENEKQVVKNEKRQGVDNRPYGHTDHVLLKALYPEGHPYSWDVIGSLEDLQNATLQDVRDFYQLWYGINNATLVIAGDFESDKAKAWVDKYFSEFKPRGDVTALAPMPAQLMQSKSLYHEDNFAKLAELTLTFATIEHYQKDAYALDLLADLLSEGKQSVLYRNLVEQDKLAPGATANNQSSELAGTFTLKVRAFDGIKLDRVKTSIDNALAEFSKSGFSDQQLARIMTRRETRFYQGLTSVFEKASTLAQHNEFAGDPGLITREIEKYRAVTRSDIMAVFNKYLQGKHYIATSFVPKGQTELALSGAEKADVVEEKIVQGAEQQEAKQAASTEQASLVTQAQKSSFDRFVVPEFGEKHAVKLPEVWQTSLSNGIEVFGIEHTELPLVSFSIRIMGGHSLDATGKNGSANLLSRIMMEGTRYKTPEQLQNALGELGAELNFSAEHEYITLTGSSLSSKFDQVLSLAQEILVKPRWDESQWQRIKQETLAEIQQANANPSITAQNVYAKLMYGAGSKLASPVLGTEADVHSISLEDVKAFYQKNMLANLTSVHVAGNIQQAKVKASLSSLANGWRHGKVKLPEVKMAQRQHKAQVYFVDVPGAKQSFIRIGNRVMTANDSNYYATVAVNHQLGGSFSGQLFQILRLEKGYTYGAYSGINRRNGGGVFTARSSVRANVTLESLQIFRQILSDYGTGFDQAALDKTKSVLAKSTARAFETTDNLMGVMQNISSYQLDKNYVAEQQQQLAKLSLQQAQDVISRYMDPDKMIYLVVGDSATQLAKVKQLGLGEVMLLDHHGNELVSKITAPDQAN